MVKAGLGFSFLARWAVEPHLRAGTLRAIRYTRRGYRRTWSAATLKDMARVPYVREFIDLLADHPPFQQKTRNQGIPKFRLTSPPVKLHTKLFIALVLGIGLGAALHSQNDSAWIVAINANLLRPIGQIFLRSIFMIVVPMVFSALVIGVYDLGRGRDLSGVAGRTLWFTVVMSSGGSTVNTLTFTYDANGNLLTAANGNGTYTLTYDALDREATVKEPFDLTLTFTYDAVGNRTKVEDSFGGVQTSTYDAANRLDEREFGGSGQTPLRIDQTYTARDQVETTVTRYSDLAGSTKIGESAFTYDAAGRLTRTCSTRTARAASWPTTPTPTTPPSRVLTETLGGATTTYAYDTTDQLTNDGTTAYSYDANGNRTMTGYHDRHRQPAHQRRHLDVHLRRRGQPHQEEQGGQRRRPGPTATTTATR